MIRWYVYTDIAGVRKFYPLSCSSELDEMALRHARQYYNDLKLWADPEQDTVHVFAQDDADDRVVYSF